MVVHLQSMIQSDLYIDLDTIDLDLDIEEDLANIIQSLKFFHSFKTPKKTPEHHEEAFLSRYRYHFCH